MRWKIILFALLFGGASFAQQNDTYMLWTNVGVKGDLVKKMDWFAEINTRLDMNGVETFFPEIGVDYKVTKWFKPSIEYRFVTDKNQYGNYKIANRLNFNAKFKEDFDRLGLGLRVRYQYAFDNRGSFDYDADFDQAFRFKPEITYDIKNFILTPKISSEFFYNPALGENGRRFDKMRLGIGASLDLNNNHDISFKYQLDKRFFAFDRGVRHVLALSYQYKL
ncbi:MAG: hypothetical protein DCO96_04240 [Fluviicola sp. XM-24bin1]|nr:MAG: hypothetical protein DCO96_04240 [Fluviicola sp. XM-24bin1]